MIVAMNFPFAVVPGFARGLADSAALSGPGWPAGLAEAGVAYLAVAGIQPGLGCSGWHARQGGGRNSPH
jgi:hypothetical protein